MGVRRMETHREQTARDKSGERSEVIYYITCGRNETLIPQNHIGLTLAHEVKQLY